MVLCVVFESKQNYLGAVSGSLTFFLHSDFEVAMIGVIAPNA